MVYPVDMTKASITSQYGWRTNPFTGQPEFHGAIDIASYGGVNLPIVAVQAGEVIQSYFTDYGGNTVYIQHADGYITRYMHMDTRMVSIGTQVLEGMQIGTMGTTGDSTGVHLDFAVLTKYPEDWQDLPNCTISPILYLDGATDPVDPVASDFFKKWRKNKKEFIYIGRVKNRER